MFPSNNIIGRDLSEQMSIIYFQIILFQTIDNNNPKFTENFSNYK